MLSGAGRRNRTRYSFRTCNLNTPSVCRREPDVIIGEGGGGEREKQAARRHRDPPAVVGRQRDVRFNKVNIVFKR